MVNSARDVTVGMPVYNDPDGLRRSVPTVFSQTFQGRVRLLLVDDGSDAETVEVIDSLAATYDGIDVVRNEHNRGRPFVRNQILQHAGDGYLAWLDAGDLWHPRKLEVQVAALEADEGTADRPVICVTPLRRYFVDRGVARTMVPEVAGDQLLNALTGRLFGYLPTMLGRTDAFRDLGFDERLLRRQDYDFLVRFVAEGGRVISTAEDLPLFTYLKSDVGANAATVAEVNAVIRAKHAEYYGRYPGSVARQVKSNQHRLVSRFHEANGDRVQAARYRWLSRLADPWSLRGDLGRVLRDVRRAVRRPGRRTARALARRTRAVLPALHRLGLVSFARRLGLIRIAGRLGLMRIFYKELRGANAGPAPSPRELEGPAAPADPDAVSEGAAAAELRRAEHLVRTSEHAGAIEVLERLISSGEASAPDVWLLLEEANRRASRLHSAQEALERGLDQHPGDRQLELRRSELKGLRRDWEGCVDTWFALAEETEEDLTSISYVRAARSLRMLERPHEAVAVAEAGLRRFPEDGRLEEELQQNRSRTVDWARAVEPAGEADRAHPAVGAVTDPGFLAGGDGPVEGDVALADQHAPRVSLLLNGTEVAATYASTEDVGTPGERTGRFSLNCRDLLDYVGDGDVITLQGDGEPVLVPGGGTRLVVRPGYASRAGELFDKLESGHVFMKFGHLSLGNTPGRKRAILASYDEVAALLEREHGYALYPLYGNLLGAIRDHDFIGHDVGGFDVGYVSRHETPEQVRAELVEICRTLALDDYYVELKPWSAYVRRSRGDKVFVDLNFAWFTPTGELNFSYGWRYAPVTDRERLLMPRESAIFGHLVPVPGNAEAVLEQMYGAHWPIPIQGFDPDAGITRDDRYLLTRDEMERLEKEFPDRIRMRSVLTPEGEVVDVG
jgi:glycosyltransferase involved in cell wall biosynthesis